MELTMTLHPDCASYLDMATKWRREKGFDAWSELDPPRARALFREGRLSKRPPLPEVDLAEDYEIEGRAGPRRIRIIRPKGAADSRLPVALYLHGGGYMVGGIDESEDEARRIAINTPALVVSASYRLAPEHPFPATVDDAYDALLWTAHHAAEFGGDASRLLVGGTSGGAGAAAAVSRLAATENGPRIALTYLLCPWLDLTMSQHSVRDYGLGYGLDRGDLDWYAAAYVGPEGRADHPLVSPVLHDVPKRLPRTFVLAAECDPLRDEARVYARKLKEAKIPVSYVLAPGMVHAFNVLTHLIPAGKQFLPAIDEALRGM